MKILGVFSLASGSLLDFAESKLNTHDNNLLYSLRSKIKRNDLLVGDCIYCSYANIFWLSEENADVVFRKSSVRKSDKCVTKKLGKNDRLVYWKKPGSRAQTSGITDKLWDELPDELCVREVTFRIEADGYRSTKITLVTTLLDHKRYSIEDLADLYLKRWRIELWFDDIKTTMKMDILRCKTPEMIDREVLMHFIAYNMIRGVLVTAAQVHRRKVEELSFKGAVDRIEEWSWSIITSATCRQREWFIEQMLEGIGKDILPDRPGRYEPRLVKRRRKAYDHTKKSRQEHRDDFIRERQAKGRS